MPVTNSAMAKTRAVPTTARRNWRRRNWTFRSVTFHMSACLSCEGSDEPDPIAVEAREPHLAVGPGGDPERRLHPSTPAVAGGDLTDRAQPPGSALRALHPPPPAP